MRRGNFKKASTQLLAKLTVRTWRCNGCGRSSPDKPAQCPACGRCDFTHFHSKAEARRFAELELMRKTGIITDLECQPRFELRADGGRKVGTYVADFRYKENGETVVEDVKGGAIEPLSKWKLSHYEAQFGHPVKLVKY